MAAEHSAEELAKKVTEMEQQLKEKEKQCSEFQLQAEKLSNELKLKEESWAEKETFYKTNLTKAEKKLDESSAESQQMSNVSFDSLEMAGQLLASQKTNQALQMELKSADLKVESTEKVDKQKTRLIELLDKKIDQVQGRNDKLASMVEQVVTDKEKLAKKLKEATFNITDMAARLSESEKLNKELRVSNKAFKEMLHSMEEKGSQIAKVAKQKLVQYSEENKSLKAEIASKGEEATSVVSEIKTADELSNMAGQLDAITKKLANLESLSSEGQGSEVMQALHTAESINAEIRSQVEKLQGDLKAKEGSIEHERSEFKSKIASLERERDELRKALVVKPEAVTTSIDPNSLKRVLEEKKKILEQAQAEASRLREALAAKIAAKASQDKASEAAQGEAVEGGSSEQDAEHATLKTIEDMVYSISSKLEEGYSEETLERETQEIVSCYEAMKTQLADSQCESLLSMLKNAELMTLISKSESTAADLEVKVENYKADVEEKVSQLEKMTLQNTETTEKLATLEQNLISMEEECMKKKEAITGTSKSLTLAEEELAATKSDKKKHEEKIEELKALLEVETGNCEESRIKLSELEGKCKDVEGENAQITNSNKNLTKHTELLEKEVATLKEQAAQLESSLNFSVEEKLNLLHQRLSSEIALKESVEKELDAAKSSSSQSQMEFQQEIEKLTSEKSDVEKALTELRTKLDSLLSEHKSVSSKIDTQQKDIKVLQSELASKSETLQTIENNLKEECRAKDDAVCRLEKAESQIKGLEETVVELQAFSDGLGLGKKNLEEQVTQLQQEKENYQKSLEEKTLQCKEMMENIKLREQELCGVQEKLNFMEESRQSIDAQFEKNQASLTGLEQQLESVESEKAIAGEKLLEFDTKVNELEQKAQSLDDENTLLREQVEKLLTEKDDMCQNMTSDKADLQVKLSSLNSDITQKCQLVAEIETKLESSSSELSDCRTALAEKSDLLDKLKEELDQLRTKLEGQLMEKDQEFESFRQEKELEISGLQENFTIMKESLERRGNLWEEERKSLDQELSGLRFQLSTEQMEHQNKLKSYEERQTDVVSMRDRVSQQEALIETLEVELRALQAEREEEREHSWNEMKKLTDNLTAKEADYLALSQTSDKLKSNLHELQSNNKKLKASLTEEQRKLEELHKKSQQTIEGLESDNHELKKKLIQLVRQKDTLWQKSDQLEYEQKQRATETWMNSSVVTSCLACKTDFSILRRKHHCRICGKIFCWDCCNNWVMTAHSSKKERVCNRCNLNISQISAASEGGDEQTEEEPDIYSSVEIPVKRSRKWTESDLNLSPEEEEEEGEDGELEVGSANLAALATAAIASSGVFSEPEPPDQDKSADLQAESSGQDSDLQLNLTTDDEQLPRTADDSKIEASGESHQDNEGLDDEVYDFITEDEIANSIMEPIPDPNMTFLSTLSSVDLLAEAVESEPELWIRAGKGLAIPLHVTSVGIIIAWKFTTQPKPIHFSVLYKEDEFVFHDDGEVLIPSTKCNSHKETISGELLARKMGIYTLVFDNVPSRFTAKKLEYTLSAKIPESASDNVY